MSTSWTRRDAWWGLGLNALVLPGLGTVIVTRAWSGFAQVLGSTVASALILSRSHMALGVGFGLLIGVAAWSVDSSVRALRIASA